MVGFDDSRKMGEHALSGVTSNFKNTIKGMIRLVGLSFDDPRASKEMSWMPGVTFKPVKHASGGPDSIGVEIHTGSEKAQVLSVEEIGRAHV